jgi:hypothetical protein
METGFAPVGAEPIGSNTAPRQLNRFPRLETAYPTRQQTPNRKIPGD